MVVRVDCSFVSSNSLDLKKSVYKTNCALNYHSCVSKLKQDIHSMRYQSVQKETKDKMNHSVVVINDNKCYNNLNSSANNRSMLSTMEVNSAFKRYQRSSEGEEEEVPSLVAGSEVKYRRLCDDKEDVRVMRRNDHVYKQNFTESPPIERTVEGGVKYSSSDSFLIRRLQQDGETSANSRIIIRNSVETTGDCEQQDVGDRTTSISVGREHSTSPDFYKRHKRTLVVHPQPRLPNNGALTSKTLEVRHRITNLRGYTSDVPNLTQFSTPHKLSNNNNNNNHLSPDRYYNSSLQERVHYIEGKTRQIVSNDVPDSIPSSVSDENASLLTYSSSKTSSSPRQPRTMIAANISKPQTSSVEEFSESHAALLRQEQQTLNFNRHFNHQKLLTSRITHCKEDTCFNVKRAEPQRTGSDLEYSTVNLAKGTSVSWCHKRASTVARVYQNLPPGVVHTCRFYESAFVPSSNEARSSPKISFNHNVNSSPDIIEIKIIKNKTIASTSENITVGPSDLSSSRNSSSEYFPTDFKHVRSSPPSLERINNTTPDINVKSSSDGTPPPPELEPEIIITESNISKDNTDTESSHNEMQHTFSKMGDYLAISENDSGRIFSWNSEETSPNHNETQQYNNMYENITESTTDNNSNEDTSAETDMDYDSDASIDVGDSYDPDPGLAATTFDNEPSNEDVEFYDEEEEEDDEDEEVNEKDSSSSSSKRFRTHDLNADYNMGAVITSSPPEIEALDDTTSELWKLKADEERTSESDRGYVIVEAKEGSTVNNAERKGFTIFQRTEKVEAGNQIMTPRNESVADPSENSEVFKGMNQEVSNHPLRINVKEDLMKPKTNKSVKSRGVYRELGMRNNSEHSEELGEFSPNASVICKESGGTCTIKSPVLILNDSSSSQVMHAGDNEGSDQELVFSLSDTALRCRMLVVLWGLLGESRLRQVGFPQEPVHKILWRTVDVCCSVAGVKSAAAVPLASDHDCGRDMVCFRDHAHRFLEVCAPTREHWKRFGWASLTVDAVVRKIYVGEILPALQFVQSADIPEKVRQSMDVLLALERASDQQKVSRGRFILPKTPLPPEQGTSSSSVRPSSSAEPEPTKKKRGRPAKITNKTDVGRVERVMLWRFLLNLLEDPRNAPCIHWVKREEGIFRILNTDWLARLWGRRHGNPRMTYEKMARAMRTYYRSKVLQPVPRSPNLPRKLVYKFNPAVIQKVAAAKLAAMATQASSSSSKLPAQHRDISS